MQNLHFKLTSKYPRYNSWHQTKHHNKIHWGALAIFTLLVFTLLSANYSISLAADTVPPTTPTNLTATAISSSQINLSWIASMDNVGVVGYKIYRCAGSACIPTTQIAASAANSYSDTGLQPNTAYTYAVSAYDAAGNESGKSTSASATTLSTTQTWQQTLEQNFDIADTFDELQDWTPTATQDCSTNNLPKKLNEAPSIWGEYCLWGNSPPNNVIGDHGVTKQVGNKSLRLNPPADMRTYFGNGDPDSGYSDMYLFFRIYLPRNGFPTRILSYPSDTTVEVDYVEGELYTWWDGWKFFNIGTGFNDTHNWNNQGFSVYGDTEIWVNWYPDTSFSVLEPRLQTFFSQRVVRGNSFNLLDKLAGIEFHYKLEEPAGYDSGFTGNGVAEMWVYDEDGNAELVLQATDMSFRPASGEGHLFNRIEIDDNKHIQAKHWIYGPGMDRAYYMDDFIIDNQPIGPTYFSLLNNQPPLPDTTPPTIPTNPTTTPISSSQINLSWNPSTDTGGSGLAGYKIYRCTGSACAPTTQIATSAANSYSDTGLNASTAYTYVVSAYDNASPPNESAKSSSVSVATLAGFKSSDLNKDVKVDSLDFEIFKLDYNRTDKPVSDINQDGIVDSRDLGIMMSEWTR